MKKLITFTLAILVAVGLLSGCAQDNTEDVSRISELEAQVREYREKLSDAEKTIIEKEEAFASEREELDNALLDAESETSDWKDKNKQLQSSLYAANQENRQLLNQIYGISLATHSDQTIFLRNGNCLSVTYDADEKPDSPYTLTLCRADGSESEIYSGGSLTSIAVSPDESKFALTNFTMEGSSDAFWYDSDTEALTEISKSDLEPNCGASAFAWLDDRYFMFVSQLDHGTLSVGGDVYVYDTEACSGTPLINCGARVQITAFMRPSYPEYRPDWRAIGLDNIIFQAVIWDETWNEIEHVTFSLSLADLLDMSENGYMKTFDGEKVY